MMMIAVRQGLVPGQEEAPAVGSTTQVIDEQE